MLAAICVKYPPATFSDFAVWVQAIGSLVAIFAAVKVVSIQHRLELERAGKDAEDRRAEALQACSGLFSSKCCGATATALDSHGQRGPAQGERARQHGVKTRQQEPV